MNCTCNASKNKISALQLDPTKTTQIRKMFLADIMRRFKLLKTIIYNMIVVQDFFELNEKNHLIPVIFNTGEFAFPRSVDKIDGFMEWFTEISKNNLLETYLTVGGVKGKWTDKYIKLAYQQGIINAQHKLKKVGILSSDSIFGRTSVQLSLSTPVHVSRVELLYSRTFNDLKGISSAMDTKISRILSQGIMDGINPKILAKEINQSVDDIGIVRARMIARTEVVRAHHLANIQEYRNAGILGVKWITSGWSAPDACSALQGKIFSLSEIEPLIPKHPNCRCTCIPILDIPNEN